jgi:hypothetical protein
VYEPEGCALSQKGQWRFYAYNLIWKSGHLTLMRPNPLNRGIIRNSRLEAVERVEARVCSRRIERTGALQVLLLLRQWRSLRASRQRGNINRILARLGEKTRPIEEAPLINSH